MNKRGGAAPTQDDGRGRAFELQTVLAVAAVCLALFWAVRATRDALVPANSWVRWLRDGDADMRVEAARGLGTDEAGPAFRPKAAGALISALADTNPEVAANAALSLSALIRAEPDADLARSWSEALTVGLRDPSPDVRSLTASAFAYAAPSPTGRRFRVVSDALAPLLADPDDELRRTGIAALGVNGTGGPGLHALMKALADDPSAANRAAAARALGDYADHADDATRAVLRGLESDRDAEVRSACADAMAALRRGADGPRWSAALVPDLIAALASPDRTTRGRAAISLGTMGPEAVAAVPALAAMLGDADDGAVGFVAGPILAPPPALAAEALGRIAPGTPSEDEAAQALAAVVRAPRGAGPGDAAALALSRFPGPWGDVVVPRLVAILDAWASAREVGGEPNTFDEMRAREILGDDTAGAVEALGRLGPIAKPALPRLREMGKLEGTRFRRIAEDAVRRIEGAAPAAPSGGRG